MSGYAVKGTSNDVTVCDHCNRRNLRSTVALVPLDADANEDGEVFYAGTGCAASLLRTTPRKIRNSAQAADNEHAERVALANERIEIYGEAVDARLAGGRLTPFRDLYFERNPHLRGKIPPIDAFNEVRAWVEEARSLLAAR